MNKLNDISKLDLNYLIIAYRGFSGNKGEPNEIGLYKDSEAAKKWLNNIGVSDKDIILALVQNINPFYFKDANKIVFDNSKYQSQ